MAVDGMRLRLNPPARRQATLALAYLLLSPARPVPADELAEAVWPQGPPKSWPSGLRRVMSEVRTWLRGGQVEAEVRSTHGTYQVLLPRGIRTDVVAGRQELSAARAAATQPEAQAGAAQRAVDHLGVPLLPGYEAPWLQQRRRAIERDVLEGLDLLSDAERRRGNPEASLAAAERAIAVDPLRESSHRLAMAAHRTAGRVGAALRQYEACRRVLTEEVGTAPSPATTTAYHDLLDLSLADEPTAGVAAPPTLPPALAEGATAIDAAATAMHRMEARQLVASLEARLATIDAAPAPDPLRRVATLIDLGRARWALEGSTEALRRISLAAGEAALSLSLPSPFADALALASTTTGIGQVDEEARDLCRRGRIAFPDDNRVQVQVLGLVAELEFGQASIDLAQAAVDAARHGGDAQLLLDMLLVLDQSLAWTPGLDRRLGVEAECNALLRQLPPSWRRRPTFEVMTRLQATDVRWLDEQGARYSDDVLPSAAWELRVYLSALRAVEAKLTGDLARAHRLATGLMEASANELNAMHATGGLLLALAREMGGIAELVPAIDHIVASNPRIAAFQAAQVLGRVVAGDADGARRLLDDLAEAGFDAVTHDHVYLLYLGLLAEAVALLDRVEHAGALLALLEPYAGQLCVGAHGIVVLNAMDSYRGMLAVVTGDRRGDTWLAAGMEAEARVRAVLLQARTAAWRSTFLRRHGTSADATTADQLLAEAREVAAADDDRAGLRGMVEQVAALA